MKVEEYMKKLSSSNSKNYLYSLTKRVLLTAVIVLIVLITCNLNKDFKSKVNKYLFETNYNFAKINSLYKKYLLEFKKGTEKVLEEVSKNNILDYTEEEKYKDGVLLNVGNNYPVKLLESGLVVFIGEKDDMKVVHIQQSNGIDVIYGNIEVSDIKVYDYIEKGTIIGSSNMDKIYLSFQKDGEVLSYEPYIKY